MTNIPSIKIGLVAVSRDCFPIELSRTRRDRLFDVCSKKGLPVVKIDTIIENEKDAMKALDEVKKAGCNASVVFLGNFGPEGPLSLYAQKFGGPVMFVAAAEEKTDTLQNGRGDAYCGVLNASYNAGLRGITPYIPEYPVGTAEEVADMIADFVIISRIVIGVKNLKILSYGPRPHDFLACNAPIKPLYDLGVEIMENSELDLYSSFNAHKNSDKIAAIKADMEKELGAGNKMAGILDKLAQYEATLMTELENNLGASEYAAFANKCWPAFQEEFGFVPCYVNSRFASKGMPISCETDIYGALTEFILACATESPVTLLDINNTVPADMAAAAEVEKLGYTLTDLFMGFHCGNTPSSCMVNPTMKYQKIMHSLLEPDVEPNITRGTLEGAIKPGEVTVFRLQSTAEATLKSYIAEGEVLDLDPQTFGSTGVFGIKEMGRFYRHVLIQHRFPHHAGVGFAKVGKAVYAALTMLGVENIYNNQPKSLPYPSENPFA